MQYILSETEYAALLREKKLRTDRQAASLQELCTLAAQHIPVENKWYPGNSPEPWGCILLEPQTIEYCDDCPSQKVCPNEHKEWSK